MKSQMKKRLFWGIYCIKRLLILLFPMLFFAMWFLDVISIANQFYPNNTAVLILKWIGGVFYISCLWYVLTPKKWNKIFLIISTCLLVGMFKLNPDIRKIDQHAKCIESTIPCPKGVVLEGG